MQNKYVSASLFIPLNLPKLEGKNAHYLPQRCIQRNEKLFS